MSLSSNYSYNYSTGKLSAVTTESSAKILKIGNEAVRISVDSIDENGLKKKITQVLLEDPDSEIKKMAEDYLIQCLYDATSDPENNPILQRYFEKNQTEINRLISDVWEVKQEILQVKSEIRELKNKLGIDCYNSDGVAWKNDVQGQLGFLESKLIRITEKLGKAGIDINYWEN